MGVAVGALLASSILAISAIVWLEGRPGLAVAFVSIMVGAVPGFIMMAMERCTVIQPGLQHCATCGYDLRGLPPGPCPECGHYAAPAQSE